MHTTFVNIAGIIATTEMHWTTCIFCFVLTFPALLTNILRYDVTGVNGGNKFDSVSHLVEHPIQMKAPGLSRFRIIAFPIHG